MHTVRANFLAGVAAITLGSIALPDIASAAQIFGSAAILTNRPCAPEATNCTGQRDFTQYAGGMNTSFATSATIPGGASAAASVSFGEGYLPTIRAGSTAGAQTRTGASAVALRTFTYEGDQAIDLALNGALHFASSGNPSGGEAPGDGLFYVSMSLLPISAISIYSTATSAEALISNSSLNFADCSAGAIAWSDYKGAVAAGDNNVNVGLSQTCGGGAITLNPGDEFLLLVSLQAISNRGGFVDAMNTFRIEYDEAKTVYTATGETVGLAALRQTITSTVPEPSTWAMMIAGFGAAGAMLRRRSPATI